MPTPPSYATYEHLLRDLTDAAMSVVESVSAATALTFPDPRLPDGVRTFCWLSAIVRRAIVVSNHLAALGPQPEERDGKLMPALIWALAALARHRIDFDTYTRMIDAVLDGEEDEDDDWLDPSEDGADPLPDPDADVPGQRPIVLLAELCRDFGMAMAGLPPDWLTAVPAPLRLLCDRAAAVSVGPAPDHAPDPGRIGHLMER